MQMASTQESLIRNNFITLDLGLKLRQFNEETITLALQPLLAPLSEKYAENAGVCGYLQAMQVYLLKTVVEQLVDDAKTDAQARKLLEEQYCPSLVVGHSVNGGAPVVFEPHPTYDNLFGRIEYSTDQAAAALLATGVFQTVTQRDWQLQFAGIEESAEQVGLAFEFNLLRAENAIVDLAVAGTQKPASPTRPWPRPSCVLAANRHPSPPRFNGSRVGAAAYIR